MTCSPRSWNAPGPRRKNDRVNRSDFVHFVSLPVQWGDMDSIGHVNNAIYFRYIESGRIAYFKALDDAQVVDGQISEGPILADIQCSFIGQLHYPAQIDIGTRTSKIGTKSFTIEAGIFEAGQDSPVATSRTRIVSQSAPPSAIAYASSCAFGDGANWAREIDPSGERTFGSITSTGGSKNPART